LNQGIPLLDVFLLPGQQRQPGFQPSLSADDRMILQLITRHLSLLADSVMGGTDSVMGGNLIPEGSETLAGG
jgi:hypothetical protein